MSTTGQYQRQHDIWARNAFAATLGPTNIPVDHIKEINIGLRGQQVTTKPPSHDMKWIIGDVVLKLAGLEICRVTYEDLYMMQNIWFGQTPQFELGAVGTCDNWVLFMGPTTIPLSLDKKEPSGNNLRSFDMQLQFGVLSALIDNVQVSADAEYISNQNISWLPAGYHYAYQYRDFTSDGTLQNVTFDRAGADLIGLVCRAPTIPVGVAPWSCTIDTLRLLCNDQVMTDFYHWEEMVTFKATQAEADDTDYGGQLNHYRYIDLSRGPYPADKMTIQFQSVTARDAARFIGIYMEP